MTWKAVYMLTCDEDSDPTQGGFKTERQACRYIAKHFCKHCRVYWYKPWTWPIIIRIVDFIIPDREIIFRNGFFTDRGWSSSCACEWFIKEENQND